MHTHAKHIHNAFITENSHTLATEEQILVHTLATEEQILVHTLATVVFAYPKYNAFNLVAEEDLQQGALLLEPRPRHVRQLRVAL